MSHLERLAGQVGGSCAAGSDPAGQALVVAFEAARSGGDPGELAGLYAAGATCFLDGEAPIAGGEEIGAALVAVAGGSRESHVTRVVAGPGVAAYEWVAVGPDGDLGGATVLRFGPDGLVRSQREWRYHR